MGVVLIQENGRGFIPRNERNEKLSGYRLGAVEKQFRFLITLWIISLILFILRFCVVLGLTIQKVNRKIC